MSLSPEARSLIDAARREAAGPSEASRARMRRKVLSAAGAGALASAASSTAAAAGAATKLGFFASLGLPSKIGLAMLAAGVAAGGARAVWSDPAPSPPPVALVVAPSAAEPERPTSQVAAPAPEALPPSVEPSVEAPPAPSAEPSAASAQPGPSAPASTALAPSARRAPPASLPQASSPTTSPPSEADALRDELALIGAAQSSLGAGRHEAALASLEEHARRFPSGALSLERRALRALALCAAGRRAEGRAEAEAFALRAAGSPLAERVASACR